MFEKHSFKFVQLLSYLAAVNLAFGLSNIIIFGKFWKDGNAYPSLLVVIIISTIIAFFLTKQFKINANFQFFQIVYNSFEFLYFFIFLVLTYWFIINSPNYYKSGIIIFFIFSFILTIVINKLSINYLRIRRNIEIPINNCIVIGNSDYSKDFKASIIRNKWLGFQYIESDIYNFDCVPDAINFINLNSIKSVFIDLDHVSLNINFENEFKDFIEENMISLYGISNIFSKKLMVGTYNMVENIPYVSLFNYPLDGPFNQIIKRGFDILFSLLIFIFVLSWLFPIIAIFIIFESGFPVFYKQKRGGNKREEFLCFKFRSMKVNKEADKKAATRNDSRITRVGKFLRATSLDELPQFYNVLIGDMSIVGPRPHMVKHDIIFGENVSKYLLRHYVKPGITGLAQIKGFRGEIENNFDLESRIKFDIFYVKNWSFYMDIYIIFTTIINVFKGDEKAY